MASSKTFLIWCNPGDSFKSLKSQLERDQWTVLHVSSTQALAGYAANEQLVCLAILNPTDCNWTGSEVQQLKKFHQLGHNLLVCSGDNETGSSNLNKLVSTFGIQFRNDCLIRPNPFADYHPKEVRLAEFVLNRGLGESLARQVQAQGHARHQITRSGSIKNSIEINASNLGSDKTRQEGSASEEEEILGLDNSADLEVASNNPHSVLYAFGCTLELLSKLSTVVIGSSRWSLPTEQPLTAFYRHSNVGRVILSGSASMFNDFYLRKEFNSALFGAFLEFIEDKSFSINMSDARTIEIPDYSPVPAALQLLNIPICCLDQPEALPSDPSELINKQLLFSLDCSMLPSIARAYRDLGLAYEPLTLIKPKLDYKPLKLEPATHGFILRRSKLGENGGKVGNSKEEI